MPRSLEGHHLDKLWWAGVPDATYQVSWKSACRFRRRFLKGFLPYMGMTAILFMWPASCHQIFISLYLKAFIKNLAQIGKVVSEKIWFEFLYVHELGPRSRNHLDLQYSHTFIYSIRWLLLLTFMAMAAIVSEKSTVFTFSHNRKT